MIVHAFDSYLLNNYNMNTLQSIQTSEARLMTHAIALTLTTLIHCNQYWLPNTQSINFIILMSICKCFHGLAPNFLHELSHDYGHLTSLLWFKNITFADFGLYKVMR